jgi:hypothetical protein
MNRLIAAVVMSAFLVPTALLAQSQSGWTPYGGLRGRMRIVERPHTTVYRARWGGGLTVQGAAVLMNLTDVAGGVAADYLSPRSQEEMDELSKRIDGLRGELDTLKKDLADVKDRIPKPTIEKKKDFVEELERITNAANSLVDVQNGGRIFLLLTDVVNALMEVENKPEDMEQRLFYQLRLESLRGQMADLRQDLRILKLEASTSFANFSKDSTDAIEKLEGGIGKGLVAIDGIQKLIAEGLPPKKYEDEKKRRGG